MRSFIGENDFIYYGSQQEVLDGLLGKAQPADTDIERWIENTKTRERVCAKNEATYAIFVCPDKHAVYPEFLPEPVVVSDYRYVDNVIGHTQVPFVYPLAELQRHKNNCELYMNGDTHWNDVGAAIAFNRLADVLNLPQKIKIDNVVSDSKIGTGDLCVNEFSNITNRTLSLPYQSRPELVWDNGVVGDCGLSVYQNQNKSLPTALCLCDSFINTQIKLFSSLFSTLVRVDARHGDWYFEFFKSKFDFVISEIVERNLPQLVKAPTDTKYLSRLKQNITNNVYSSDVLKKLRLSLSDENCIYQSDERHEIVEATEVYQKQFISQHVAQTAQFSNELEKLSCLVGLCENKVVGAVVVNCNPFTRGHEYLITCAARQVDLLLVFVLQEDKSCFPFLDRFLLVLKGTNELQNVVPIPSGQLMISSLTFPDYFDKETIQEVQVDASLDLDIFSKFIAPKLGIRIRFVGNEPFCAVTNQYNQQMVRILSEHGINVIQLNRLEVDSVAVSASRVRKLLRTGEFDIIKTLVPSTTLSYLKEIYLNGNGLALSALHLVDSDNIISLAEKLHKLLVTSNRFIDAKAVTSYIEKLVHPRRAHIFS